MRRVVAAFLLLALLLVVQPAWAKPVVVLSGGPTFTLDIPPALRNDAGSMWVNVTCWEGGTPVVVEDQGVEFEGRRPTTGTAGPFTWEEGCTAYVWVYPEAATPVSNVLGF